MTKIIFIVLSLLTIVSIYSTYTGMGLQGVDSENTKSSRLGSHTYGSSYSGGWSYGK